MCASGERCGVLRGREAGLADLKTERAGHRREAGQAPQGAGALLHMSRRGPSLTAAPGRGEVQAIAAN